MARQVSGMAHRQVSGMYRQVSGAPSGMYRQVSGMARQVSAMDAEVRQAREGKHLHVRLAIVYMSACLSAGLMMGWPILQGLYVQHGVFGSLCPASKLPRDEVHVQGPQKVAAMTPAFFESLQASELLGTTTSVSRSFSKLP